MTKKSDIREVKTVKTTKSDMERKNPSKSATIWNQTVSAITKARSEIFQKFQNSASTIGPWLLFTNDQCPSGIFLDLQFVKSISLIYIKF